MKSKILALKVNELDNVATLFSNDGDLGNSVEIRDQKGACTFLNLKNPIPYGHKIALIKIETGVPIMKYGEEIGVAVKDIEPGEHVHIHNMDSQRGRGDLNTAVEG